MYSRHVTSEFVDKVMTEIWQHVNGEHRYINFCSLTHTILSEGYSVLLLLCISFFLCLVSKVIWSIISKILTCLMVTQIYNIGSEVWGTVPKKFGIPKAPKNWGQISDNFAVWLQISPEWHKISSDRKWRWNCNLSCRCTFNSVSFGTRTAKVGPEFWLT